MEALAAAVPMDQTQISRQTLEQIFREHYGLVFRAAYRVTGNVSDAEDVLQTVFLRLAGREAAADAVEHMKSYLHRAAINSALDLLRSRHGRDVPLEDAAAELPQDPSLAADREQKSGEIRDWVRRAVARLSPRAAEIFVLRFLEGKNNPEIARELGTTEATVAVTVSKSREKIRKELRTYLGGRP